jgi:regulator of nucleoside diphosphate kinase
VLRDDLPSNVATLNSRVTFSVNGRDPDTRVLSNERMTSPIGLFILITTPRGLALLGLAEGQAFELLGRDGARERIVLGKVHYQPEAARRERERHSRQSARKPVLKLVGGALFERERVMTIGTDGFDDPGPSAA